MKHRLNTSLLYYISAVFIIISAFLSKNYYYFAIAGCFFIVGTITKQPKSKKTRKSLSKNTKDSTENELKKSG